jgi:hypothetical protein
MTAPANQPYVSERPVPKPRQRTKATPVPRSLIYEEWKGKPVYYKGYQEVLAGTKNIEEIMSCSDLQGVIVYLLNGFLYTHLNRKLYTVGTNESGLHMAKNDNLGNDLAIFEKAKVGKLKGKFFSVPPKVVIEVDIKADLESFLNEGNYLFQKSQKMIDFGTERVIWILTETRKVFVASHDQKEWIITDWDQDIVVLDNCVLNLKQLLDEEEIDY